MKNMIEKNQNHTISRDRKTKKMKLNYQLPWDEEQLTP
jgi:hypothetical protein